MSITINKLNEALTIVWLEDMATADNESILLQMDKPYGVLMNADKRNALLDKLYSRVISLSFGELLTKAMEHSRISLAEVSSLVELQESYVRSLQEDKIVVNNIPVFILKKLLNQLRIPFNEAKSAILKTFEILRSNFVETEEDLSVHPAFRKGKVNSHGDSYKRLPNRALFENQESLNKYLDRLEKIMQ